MSTSASLSAAADDRKARLAQLKSLKRKEPPAAQDAESQDVTTHESERQDALDQSSAADNTTSKYLSGRNYDFETRGAKLGFENAPNEGQSTLEAKAKALADATKTQMEAEEKADKPLDLFKLQPKRPNWDLKRDLEKKLETLNVRTDNAIARMVRERVQSAQNEATGNNQNGQSHGLDGKELVEAMHMREREDEAEERREREDFDEQ